MRPVHVITVGDHYSPRTGSAIPTVVHGLSEHRPDGSPNPAVVVARGTYPDRYPSAEAIEYRPRKPLQVGPVGERHVDAGLSVLGLPRWAARRSWRATVASQSKWPPSVVLAHNAPQLIPLVDTGRHVPVLYAHNQLFGTYRPRESGSVLRDAAAVICVSNALADELRDRLPVLLHDRLRVVHNGVDVEAFRRSGPLERQGPLRVVFLGRMIPDKGADVLVAAVRKLARADIELTLVGSSGFSASDPLTPFESEIRRQLTAMVGRSSIRPFVPRHEVAALLQQADVAVVPSRWREPFALTVLEAMAAGAAVVASRIGGIPEALGGAGVLVDPGDDSALADAIEALADDESYRLRVARECLAQAQRSTWTAASARLSSVLRECT
jgi:glycosyltransferase involved in cell wall biosynthesis